MCGRLKKTLGIVLYIITAVLCVALISALIFWMTIDRCSPDICSELVFARDVVVATIPLIGICVMFIIINFRSTRHLKQGK